MSARTPTPTPTVLACEAPGCRQAAIGERWGLCDRHAREAHAAQCREEEEYHRRDGESEVRS